MSKVNAKTIVRDMRKARLNPGPHACPPVANDGQGGVIFMTVPEHLQGYVLRYVELYDHGHKKRGDLLQEIFWATLRALPEWQKGVHREASAYVMLDEWKVVAVFDGDDQD